MITRRSCLASRAFACFPPDAGTMALVLRLQARPSNMEASAARGEKDREKREKNENGFADLESGKLF